MKATVFMKIPLLLVSLVSATLMSSVRWVPKEGKTYELDNIEKLYLASPTERYAYLTNVFSALMTAEDVDRGRRVLKRIRAWGKYTYIQHRQETFLTQSEALHDSYDKFLLNLRKREEARRAKVTDTNHEMMELARGNSRPSNSPCIGSDESEAESRVINEIFSEILRENVQGGWAILESPSNAVIRPRLFRIELVLILLRLATTHHQPCIDLWDKSWDSTPYQKFIILRTYETALNAGISRELSEPVVSNMMIFSDVREMCGGNTVLVRDVLDRLLLALGNHQAEARLSSQPNFVAAVNECRARHGASLQTKIIYQAPATIARETTIRYVQPPPQTIVVPKVAPAILRVATTIPQPTRMRTILVPRMRTAHHVVVTRPVEHVRTCPLPDRRFLVEEGRTLKQGLKWFVETTNLNAVQINEIQTLINLIDSVELTVKQHSIA